MKTKTNNVIAQRIGVQDLIPANRCVGSSTSQALHYIASALQSPGTPHFIRDHAAKDSYDRKINENTLRLVQRYIEKLGFVGFSAGVDRLNRCFVRFDLYPASK